MAPVEANPLVPDSLGGMAVLPIVITGDPVLHSPAEPVEKFDKALHTLVADMVETMHKAPGVGLAAPQVGVPLRLFVWHWRTPTASSRRASR